MSDMRRVVNGESHPANTCMGKAMNLSFRALGADEEGLRAIEQGVSSIILISAQARFSLRCESAPQDVEADQPEDIPSISDFQETNEDL